MRLTSGVITTKHIPWQPSHCPPCQSNSKGLQGIAKVENFVWPKFQEKSEFSRSRWRVLRCRLFSDTWSRSRTCRDWKVSKLIDYLSSLSMVKSLMIILYSFRFLVHRQNLIVCINFLK